MDRNREAVTTIIEELQVVPYVGTWIEIFQLKLKTEDYLRRSLRGNVDRNGASAYRHQQDICRSLRGNVDRNTTGLTADNNSLRSFPTWERG